MLEFRYILLFLTNPSFSATSSAKFWRSFMLHKLFVYFLLALALLVSGCGDDGGAASGKWVGEVYDTPNSTTSREVGEFGSYDECVAATQKDAKTGVFNCGVK